MKVLSKKEIIAKKEVAHTIGERKILQRSLDSPFLVGLKFSFQTDTDLYLITDFKSGGELFWHLQKETRFSEERARFYIAELVLALEHLHKYDIVYRWVPSLSYSDLYLTSNQIKGFEAGKYSSRRHRTRGSL
jgi:serine/threonine protein kinase SCH9